MSSDECRIPTKKSVSRENTEALIAIKASTRNLLRIPKFHLDRINLGKSDQSPHEPHPRQVPPLLLPPVVSPGGEDEGQADPWGNNSILYVWSVPVQLKSVPSHRAVGTKQDVFFGTGATRMADLWKHSRLITVNETKLREILSLSLSLSLLSLIHI